MKTYIKRDIPRLPLDGMLDLTYRCNNNCRHCWLRLSPNSCEKTHELTFDEIRNIVDQARKMGTQAWHISGGEPILRPDFVDLFDYITRKSVFFNLNTNGTLITPEIAQLLKRRGRTMVALYGATATVHDYITGTPGSFEAALRGISYLKEAEVQFVMQIVPMRSNFYQFEQMKKLAMSLSEDVRIGAPWLWFSADCSLARNREIRYQRLDPKDVVLLDEPNPANDILNLKSENNTSNHDPRFTSPQKNNYLFSSCIDSRRDFHIDPFGGMSFCYYIKDPKLRFDLRQGTFQEAWDEFIPSLSKLVHGGKEYQENCGSCDLRNDCRWCPVYGFLEHGRYSAKVEYLCRLADETRRYKEDWKLTHIRYYQIAGITIQLSADFPLKENTFLPKYQKFQVEGPGDDNISIRLVSSVPELSDLRLGQEIYSRSPWSIFQQRDSFIYMDWHDRQASREPHLLVMANKDHNVVTVYRKNSDFYKRGNIHSLSTLTTDQIFFTQFFVNRQALLMHSSAMVINGNGLVFVGHSDAGKSTILKMLRGKGEILCDDRNIIRRWKEGFRVHGTWSHGELHDVSPNDAPLRAILFLEQAKTNELMPIIDEHERFAKVLSYVIRAVGTKDWWDKIINLARMIASEVPAYRLKFDKSGKAVDVLNELY